MSRTIHPVTDERPDDDPQPPAPEPESAPSEPGQSISDEEPAEKE